MIKLVPIFIILFCLVFLLSCTATMEETVREPQADPIVQEVKEILDEEEFQPDPNKNYQLVLSPDQDGVTVLDRKILIRKLEDTPVTLRNLYTVLAQLKLQLTKNLYYYNFMVDRFQEIHDHPDLNIDLPVMPEKATLHWYIPLSTAYPE